MSRTRPLAADEDAFSPEELDDVSRSDLDDPVKRAQWLEAVLRYTFDMDAEDARRVSGLVIDQFGDKDEVLDDEIPNEIRSVFYTLEDKRILTFRRIEYEGEDGMTKRGFFWQLYPEGAPSFSESNNGSGQDDDVYENLPEDCWERSESAAA